MSMFKKASDIEICSFTEDRMFVGLKRTMDEERFFKEGPEIANSYAEIKTSLQHLKKPVITIAAMYKKDDKGNFDYFFGDEVTRVQKLKEPLSTMTIQKGTLYAKVPVKVGSSVTLAYHVAKIRQKFYTQWLPESGYHAGSNLEDLEVYKYRKRRFRRAKKLMMDLYFIIEKDD